MLKLSAVVAAYDERENIEELTRRLDRVLRGLPGIKSEILFVVEGRDGTRETLERLRPELGPIRILYSETPTGLGAAFRRGFAAVAPDVDLVVTLDADLNHRPEEIPRLLEERERRNADVLIGSRFVDGARSDGIPLWKRAVSGLMNKVIGSLFDVEALDKTSGFRIYRAAALRELSSFRNDDFAFLPEMLIRASVLGLRIEEAPIHFTFRTRGESKMSIVPASRSYLKLLRSRFDRLSVAALGFLLLGVVVRVLYAFPTHKYAPDADSVLSSLRAFDILHGKLRVFYSHLRIGALESYLNALVFTLFGVSRTALSVAPLLAGVVTLLAFFFFVRELFGRETGAAAMLFLAVPSSAYIAWTYMPNGYPETLLFCALVLYFTARLARTGPRPWPAFLLGLFAGLGFWNSLQTLVCTIPALLWLAARRRSLLRDRRSLGLGIGGFLLGALPWILFNVRYPLASLRENFAARPAHGVPEVLSNLFYFATYEIRELLLGENPLGGGQPRSALQRLLLIPAGIVEAVALLFLVFVTVGEFRRFRAGIRKGSLAGLAFVWLLAGTMTALYVLSEAGEMRGLTVRYVLPLYFVFAAALGIFTAAAWKRNRALACLLAGAVLLFHFAGYYLPGSRERKRLQVLMREESQVVRFLEANQVRWVCGNYWIVYPLNFVSEERILGLPFQPNHDHYGYEGRLPPRPVPWALVAHNPQWLLHWVRESGLLGRIVPVGNNYFVFLPSPQTRTAWSPRKTLSLLRGRATWGH